MSIKSQKKFEIDLKKSKEKKIKQLDLKEQQIINQRKNYLENLKNNGKEFFNKIKQKNDLLLNYSNKYIKEKRSKKEKDYLFNKLKEKFENNEKKLIDKVNMIKKDSLVSKKELKELSKKIKQQKKLLLEESEQKKKQLVKLWSYRSKTLPIYKNPLTIKIQNELNQKIEKEKEEEKKGVQRVRKKKL